MILFNTFFHPFFTFFPFFFTLTPCLKYLNLDFQSNEGDEIMVDITEYKSRLKSTKIKYISENPRGDFLDHLSAEGFHKPKVLRDGIIDRIDDPTDKKGKKSGWYIYNQYDNIAIASYGSWKDGSKHNWTSKSANAMSFAERIKLNETIKEQNEKRKIEEAEAHDRAAAEAFQLFKELEDASPDNPYLVKKQVKPCAGLKQSGDILYMPILDNGAITSYQKIMPDGKKRMKTGGRKKGCSFTIDGDASVIYISEGLSTGLSIHEATGNMVKVAIDCGNLYEVSQNVKRRNPDSHIVLAGENNEANKSKCAQIDLPVIFPPSEDHDDFNDMHVALGLEAVKEVLKPKKEKPKKKKKADEKIFKFGGVLDEIIDYYNATSGNEQPLFAIQAAFAVCSVILARNFITNYSNMTGLFMLNLGKSGTGKEHGKKVIEKILSATENENLIGGDGYTSSSAVISALQHRPRHISIVDEFSKNIEASNNKSGGHHLKEANAKMMEVFGRLDGTIRARAYATIGLTESKKEELANQYVINPSLTLLAMSTPDDFFNNIGEQSIKDGFINRFIICVSDAQRQQRQYKSPLDVPSTIIDWDLAIKERHGNEEEFSTEEPKKIQIPFTMECIERQKLFEQKCIDLANELEEFSLEDVPMRANEISMRMALIIALSENPECTKIEPRHIDLATDWVDYNLRKTVKTLKMSISGSQFEADKKLILKALRNRKITRSDMHKRAPFSQFKTRELNEILQALLESGLAITETIETAGRPKIIWTAT